MRGKWNKGVADIRQSYVNGREAIMNLSFPSEQQFFNNVDELLEELK